jgi:hypothetical protein
MKVQSYPPVSEAISSIPAGETIPGAAIDACKADADKILKDADIKSKGTEVSG